jgi:hypothetical protein
MVALARIRVSDGPPSKLPPKREVSLFDTDYWQSLQNGISPLVSAPKSKAEPMDTDSPKRG